MSDTPSPPAKSGPPAGKSRVLDCPSSLTFKKLLLQAFVGLAALALVVGVCSLIGVYKVDLNELLKGEPKLRLVWEFRLQRLTAAAVVGAGLAAAGMALQGLMRNPLADPYVLGISSGAGVGVLLGLALAGWNVLLLPDWASTPVLAFAGALLSCLVVYVLAQRHGRLDAYTLILSGVIVNIFNGAVMLTIYLFIDPYRLADFAHWSMGQIPVAIDQDLLWLCGLCVAGSWGLLLLTGSALNALGLGDQVAASSGVSVNTLRVKMFVLVGLMTASAVALAGPVGFVGLIVPHICRMILGPDHRTLLVVSGFAGAIFLVIVETLCQAAGPWVNCSRLPIGIVTALAGGPFFLFLLRRRFSEAPV